MHAEVAIVGAGPAGAWTAYLLARGGARVLLFDPSHPREKPCGGGVTGRALDIVADAAGLDCLPAVAIRSARFTSATSADSATVPLDGRALAVASRTEFDGRLLDAAERAGAVVVRARVSDVRPRNGGFEIETAAGVCRAAFLVGADGANSLVRRRLARRFRRDQLSIATGFFAHGVTSDEIVIELLADPPGYIWSFPRPTHLAIGICAPADAGITAESLRHTAAGWIARTGIADRAKLEAYSWPIPSLAAEDCVALEAGGSRWCLVGDAAGLVDPITREGIYFALLSAETAAHAWSESGDFSRYVPAVRDGVGAEVARAARLKHAFFRPRFTRLLIDALAASPAVRGVMADLVAGRQGYRDLKWRLMKTLELRLASRLLYGRMRERW